MTIWKDPPTSGHPSIITVGNEGQDFTTIKAAVDYRNTQSLSFYYIIEVYPPSGVSNTYFEDNPITVHQFTSIIGKLENIPVIANNPNQDLFVIDGTNVTIENLTLSGSTSSGKTLLKNSQTSCDIIFSRLKLTGADSAARLSGAGSNISFYQCNIYYNVFSELNYGIYASNGTVLNLFDTIVYGMLTFLFASNNSTQVYSDGLTATSVNDTVYALSDTCLGIFNNSKFFNCTKCVTVDTTATFNAVGFVSDSTQTYEIQQLSSTAIVNVTGFLGNTGKLSFFNTANFHLNDPGSTSLGGTRYRTTYHSTSTTVNLNERIAVISVAGITLTLPDISAVVENLNFLPMITVMNYSGGTAYVTATSSMNGLSDAPHLTRKIPIGGSVTFAGIVGGDWITFENDAVEYADRNLLRYNYLMSA